MSKEKLVNPKITQLLLLTSFASAVMYFLSTYTYNAYASMLYSLLNFFIMPLMAFGAGSFYKQVKKEDRTVLLLGILFVFWAENMLTFWVRTFEEGSPSFNMFKTFGSSWFFIGALIWILCTDIMVWAKEKLHLPMFLTFLVFSALSICYGFLDVENYFGFRQALSFLPVFLIGWTVSSETIKKYRKSYVLAILCILLVLAVCGAVFLKPGIFANAVTLLNGSASYQKIFTNHAYFGAALRCIQWAGALCAGLVAIVILPKKLPIPLRVVSDHWYCVWFYARPAVYVYAGLAVLLGRLPAGLILAVILLLLPNPVTAKPILAIYRLPCAMGISVWGKKSTLGIYGYFFMLLTSTFYGIFSQLGRTMVWQPDGQKLYFISLSYTREYVLNVIHNLISTGQLVLPQWDLSIGQGSSILTVLKYNPLYFLAALFPKSFMVDYYAIMAFGALLLAAFGVRLFFKSVHFENEIGILIGTMIYIFSGYTLVAIRHIIFVFYFILCLPYLLYACERFLQKRKGGFFVFMVFSLFMIGGYYGAWVNSLLMAFYLFFRSICKHRTKIGAILKDLFQLIGLYLWGLLLAAFIFLPSVYNFFASSRVSITKTTRFGTYDEAYYYDLITNFISGNPELGSWIRLAFPGLVMLAVIALFFRHKDKVHAWAMRFLLVWTIFCMCMPLIGSITNGMGYVTNRWCYGFALLMGAVAAFTLPRLTELKLLHKLILILLSGGYAALVLHLADPNQADVYMKGMILFIGMLVLVLLVNHMKNKVYAQEIIAVALMMALGLNIVYYYSAETLDIANTYMHEGTMEKLETRSPEAIASNLSDSSVYRTECMADNQNLFILNGGNGTSHYVSTMKGEITEYYLDFGLDSVRNAYSLWGLDGRASLDSLASVKYFIADDDETGYVPYGYTLTDSNRDDTTLDVYENQYALPIGYCYDSYMTQEDFKALTPLERQQAIMQSAVVYDDDLSTVTSLTEKEAEISTTSIPYTVIDSENVTLEDHKLVVGNADDVGTITLAFEGLPDSETYLSIANPASNCKVIVKAYSDELGTVKTGKIFETKSQYYYEREELTFNLGYSENGLTTCRLKFKHKGTYTFDSIKLYCQPMSDYRKDVTALGQNVLTNVKEINSGLSGEITLDQEKLLLLDVPYSDSWTVLVDGQKTDYIQANTMYMGVMLKPGHHTVTITYHVPGLMIGAGVSLASLVITLLFLGARKIYRRRKASSKAK